MVNIASAMSAEAEYDGDAGLMHKILAPLCPGPPLGPWTPGHFLGGGKGGMKVAPRGSITKQEALGLVLCPLPPASRTYDDG